MPRRSRKSLFHTYNPTKYHFKPIISEITISKISNATQTISKPDFKSEDDQYSEWNGISDAENTNECFLTSYTYHAHSNLLDNDAESTSFLVQYFDALDWGRVRTGLGLALTLP